MIAMICMLVSGLLVGGFFTWYLVISLSLKKEYKKSEVRKKISLNDKISSGNMVKSEIKKREAFDIYSGNLLIEEKNIKEEETIFPKKIDKAKNERDIAKLKKEEASLKRPLFIKALITTTPAIIILLVFIGLCFLAKANGFN